MDCFVAEPVIGLAEGETRWLLAMTVEGVLLRYGHRAILARFKLQE